MSDGRCCLCGCYKNITLKGEYYCIDCLEQILEKQEELERLAEIGSATKNMFLETGYVAQVEFNGDVFINDGQKCFESVDELLEWYRKEIEK